MKIKFGSIVVNGSGKLGGHVYSSNRGGNYIRTLATPSNPQTPAQQTGRSIFTTLTKGWSSLTQSERDTWNGATGTFEKTDQFGDTRELSGKGLYISLNKELILIEQAKINTAPSALSIVFPGVFAPTVTALDSTIVMNFESIPPIPGLVVRSSGPVSAGTSFVKDKLRNIAVNETADDGVMLGAAYEERFGALVVGQKIAFSVYTVNLSGQRSPQLTIFAIVV